MLLLNGLSGGQIGPWRADLPGITDGCVGWDKDQTNADDWREFSSASNATVFLVHPFSTLHTYTSFSSPESLSIRSYSDQHGSCRECCLVAAYFCLFVSMLVNEVSIVFSRTSCPRRNVSFLPTFLLFISVHKSVLHDGPCLWVHLDFLWILQSVPMPPSLRSEVDGYFGCGRSAVAGPHVADDTFLGV